MDSCIFPKMWKTRQIDKKHKSKCESNDNNNSKTNGAFKVGGKVAFSAPNPKCLGPVDPLTS